MKKKRIDQWLEAVALAGRSVGIPWLTMLRAALSGPVPRQVWMSRMETCRRCLLYSQHKGKTGTLHLCKSTYPGLEGHGCHCAVNISAITANPYGMGCFGRNLDPELGWGPYTYRSRWERARLTIDFLLYPFYQNIRKSNPRNRPTDVI